MKTHKRKFNIPMCIACVLFCLTLLSIHLTGGLFAKYTTAGDGEDSARVATFDVKITEGSMAFSENFLLEIVPNENAPVAVGSLTVANNSEVAVAYTITVENITQNIPLIFKVGDSTEVTGSCSFTYTMAPGSVQECDFSVIWKPSGALKYMGMVDLINISVTAVQID